MSFDLQRPVLQGAMVGNRYMSDPMEVRPEWEDFNGHLNMAFYGVLFDWGSGPGFRALGLGGPHRDASGFTSFTGDFRVRYLREIHSGDMVRCSFILVKAGTKTFHFAQELVHEDGWISATAETLNLHVDMQTRKVVPHPPEVQARLEAMEQEHRAIGLPDWVGAPLGVRG
ncbi:hypothetical protein ATO6_10840 [Oceanicola sp. 22II-s10i]|uniref:acyl-CoA thioesterase n=1 Tax=Oceanicola sp. 22II-s10i TaxID=1317116 RepID=UPI000B626A55|nr:thioesterase family protein [Oceanicola sp. 22II-s10i]OWU84807.1 hypothetical protein ATO6_10840 [Oceanicola sp. 22II-s10i]